MDGSLGPQAVVAVPRPGEAPLAFRLNQHLAARVLGVEGDQVALALQGARLIARLVNPERSAELRRQRVARFSVRGFERGRVVLQHLGPAQSEVTQAEAGRVDYLAHFLRHLGLQDEVTTRGVVRALLDQEVTVTAEGVREITALLVAMGLEGPPAAQAAARLKAAGLPLTETTLRLVLATMWPMAVLAEGLRRDLERLLRASPGGIPLSDLEATLEILRAMLVRPDATDVEERLRVWLATLGRVVQRSPAGAGIQAAGLRLLARLADRMAQAGQEEIAERLWALLDAARGHQLLHASRMARAAPRLDLPLLLVLSTASGEARPLQARVRWEATGKGDRRQATAWMHLALPLSEGEALYFDFLLDGRSLSGTVVVEGEALLARARRELPALTKALRARGFRVGGLQVMEGVPEREAGGEAAPARLDVEV